MSLGLVRSNDGLLMFAWEKMEKGVVDCSLEVISSVDSALEADLSASHSGVFAGLGRLMKITWRGFQLSHVKPGVFDLHVFFGVLS